MPYLPSYSVLSSLGCSYCSSPSPSLPLWTPTSAIQISSNVVTTTVYVTPYVTVWLPESASGSSTAPTPLASVSTSSHTPPSDHHSIVGAIIGGVAVFALFLLLLRSCSRPDYSRVGKSHISLLKKLMTKFFLTCRHRNYSIRSDSTTICDRRFDTNRPSSGGQTT